MFCNNCGQRGHVFRDCKDPILSCGIILVRNKGNSMTPVRLPIQPDQLELLMVRRRDSMSYTEFVRGKSEVTDTDYILRLLNNMTVRERNRIAIESFE